MAAESTYMCCPKGINCTYCPMTTEYRVIILYLFKDKSAPANVPIIGATVTSDPGGPGAVASSGQNYEHSDARAQRDDTMFVLKNRSIQLLTLLIGGFATVSIYGTQILWLWRLGTNQVTPPQTPFVHSRKFVPREINFFSVSRKLYPREKRLLFK